MKETLISLLTAVLSALGFALIFKVKRTRIPLVVAGGAISWGTYLLCARFSGDLFLCCLIATIMTAAYSEICARTVKAPVIVFLTPGIIPLIPGGNLYYSISSLLGQDYSGFVRFLFATLETALGIAAGIVGVSIVSSVWTRALRKRRNNVSSNTL